jgi:alanine racemase
MHSLEPEIYSFRSLNAFVKAVERGGVFDYPIHIKIDSGMHRLGFEREDIAPLCEQLAKHAGKVRVGSIFTHLCVADDPSQDEYTAKQLELFKNLCDAITTHLDYPVLRHAAASAAMLRFKDAHFDMCRLGLGLYGYGFKHNDELQPVAALKTRIVQIRERKRGEAIGYGRSEVLQRDSLIATIPLGYADGLDRHLGGGRWSMLVSGCAAPTVGRICMDSCMIDVTDIAGVQEGDLVSVFSSVAGNTAEDMARVLDTIPYEILTSVSARVKRIYVRE